MIEFLVARRRRCASSALLYGAYFADHVRSQSRRPRVDPRPSVSIPMTSPFVERRGQGKIHHARRQTQRDGPRHPCRDRVAGRLARRRRGVALPALRRGARCRVRLNPAISPARRPLSRPGPAGSTISGLMSSSASSPSRWTARCETRTSASASASTSAGGLAAESAQQLRALSPRRSSRALPTGVIGQCRSATSL